MNSDAAVFVGFHHIQLAMPKGQEEAARSFYVEILGFGEVPKPEHLAKRGGCWFDFEGLQVHLGVEEEFRPAQKAHPALIVEGLDDLDSRLQAAGIEVTYDTQLDGHRRFYAPDVFGNRLEFIERARSDGDA